jgi:hypothetical protein
MRFRSIIAASLLVAGSAYGADPKLLNLVMPEAQIMAGVNVTTAKISPFGQFILGRIGSMEAAGTDPGFQKFIEATGFDPRKDVAEVLLASTGDRSNPGGLILAKGAFNVALMVEAAKKQDHGPVVSTYAGATLFSIEPAAADGNSPAPAKAEVAHGLAFLDGSIAVAGDLASVKAALDRAKGVNSIAPALAARVQALSTATDAWTVSLASLASLLPVDTGSKGGSAAQPLQSIKNVLSSSGGVKLGTDIQITGQAVATDAPSAKSLGDLVRMVGALVTMGAGQDPQMAAAAQLVQNLKVSEDGATVNLSLTVPESQVETLIQAAAASSKAKPEARRKL